MSANENRRSQAIQRHDLGQQSSPAPGSSLSSQGVDRIAVLFADYSAELLCNGANSIYLESNEVVGIPFCVIDYLNPPSWGRGVVSNLSRVYGTRTIDIMPNELVLRQQIATTEDVLPCRAKHSPSGCL